MKIGSIFQALQTLGMRISMAALLALLCMQIFIVLARYVFGSGQVWMQELAVYLHGATIMFACGWVYLKNLHVRVDVFSDALPERTRMIIDKVGFVVFSIPLLFAVLYFSIPYVWRSFSIAEGSTEMSGLPGLYLLKSLLVVFAVLMILGGAMRAFTLNTKREDNR